MCLLVKQPATSRFTDDFLKGVYKKNGDGLGVMWAENNTLQVRKFLPKTLDEFVAAFREHIEGKDCVWHARMQTHGHIDMTNCHPYEVLGAEDGYPVYLAHNGVLSTGNHADTSKSDTWHYIQNFIRPMLLENPKAFMSEWFRNLIGSHIGSSNKFALMDAKGNVVLVNEHVFVEHEGALLSNTYAWDTAGTKYAPKPVQHYGGYFGHGSYYGNGSRVSYSGNSRTPRNYNGKPLWASDDSFDEFESVSKDTGTTVTKPDSNVVPINKANSMFAQEYGDREDWHMEMDEVLFSTHRNVYTTLPWLVLDDYYTKAGKDAAWELYDWIDLFTAEQLHDVLEKCEAPSVMFTLSRNDKTRSGKTKQYYKTKRAAERAAAKGA